MHRPSTRRSTPTRSTAATAAAWQQLGVRVLPWLWALAVALALAGLVLGLGWAHGEPGAIEAQRIALLHRPAVWLSGVLYAVMAVLGVVGLVTGDALPCMLAGATLPTGALMSFIALWTGALHDRPVRGQWWTGDTWGTLEAALLLIYLALLGLKVALGDSRRAQRLGAGLSLAGGATLLTLWAVCTAGSPGTSPNDPAADSGLPLGMAWAQGLLAGAFTAYGAAAILARTRTQVLEQCIGLDQRPTGTGS